MRYAIGTAVLLASSLSGCAAPLHAEMLGESIKLFGGKTVKLNNEKLWITSAADSACDSGCQLGGCVNKDKGGGGITGGLFGGGGGSRDGSSSYDRLAYEVFSNYFTQRKKARVLDAHRHVYPKDLNVDTHKKIEFLAEQKPHTTASCEDLCVLDEAKKRSAEKVLVYHVLEMTGDEMKIHFRLTDVATGIVESSQTIKVMGLRAFDSSPPGIGGSAKAKNEPAAEEPAQ